LARRAPECHIQGVWSILLISVVAVVKVTKAHKHGVYEGSAQGVLGMGTFAALYNELFDVSV
jgi:hypothetical protein